MPIPQGLNDFINEVTLQGAWHGVGIWWKLRLLKTRCPPPQPTDSHAPPPTAGASTCLPPGTPGSWLTSWCTSSAPTFQRLAGLHSVFGSKQRGPDASFPGQPAKRHAGLPGAPEASPGGSSRPAGLRGEQSPGHPQDQGAAGAEAGRGGGAGTRGTGGLTQEPALRIWGSLYSCCVCKNQKDFLSNPGVQMSGAGLLWQGTNPN